MDEDYEYPRLVKFRLGWNTITAKGDLIDPFYPHVIKATLHHGIWHRCVRAVASAISRLWMPSPMRRLLRRLWPRYFWPLPDCVVLKKLRKSYHVLAFEHETEMYERLRTVQGSLIPVYFGEADCEGKRTKVLSFLPYPNIRSLPTSSPPLLSLDEFARRTVEAIDDMIGHGGVVQEDDQISNVLVADDGRFLFVDLESVYAPNERVGPTLTRKYAIDGLVERYADYLKILELEEQDREKERARLTRPRQPPVFRGNAVRSPHVRNG